MEWVAAQNVAPRLMENFVTPCVTTGSPECYPRCGLHVPFMERTGHVSGCFCVAFTGGTSPRPAFVLTTDVNLGPEVTNGPVDVEVKVTDIDCATPLLNFLHAV